MFSKTLPQTTTEFRSAIEKQAEAGKSMVTDFLKSMAAQSDAFRSELEKLREHDANNSQRILAALDTNNRLVVYLIATVRGGMQLSDGEKKMLGVS